MNAPTLDLFGPALTWATTVVVTPEREEPTLVVSVSQHGEELLAIEIRAADRAALVAALQGADCGWCELLEEEPSDYRRGLRDAVEALASGVRGELASALHFGPIVGGQYALSALARMRYEMTILLRETS